MRGCSSSSYNIPRAVPAEVSKETLETDLRMAMAPFPPKLRGTGSRPGLANPLGLPTPGWPPSAPPVHGRLTGGSWS
jgi:hypothetical protein